MCCQCKLLYNKEYIIFNFQEEQDYVLTYTWRGFGSDCESELVRVPRECNMADERRVPAACDTFFASPTDQTAPATVDQLDGEYLS